MRIILTLLTLSLIIPRVSAELPPQQRDKADAEIVGVVKSIKEQQKKVADGIRTNYTAMVLVQSVAKGKGVKAGDTIEVAWLHMTKKPSKPLAGAYGHDYKLKAKDKARFWLIKTALKNNWAIIYNQNGVEKEVEKKDKDK